MASVFNTIKIQCLYLSFFPSKRDVDLKLRIKFIIYQLSFSVNYLHLNHHVNCLG